MRHLKTILLILAVLSGILLLTKIAPRPNAAVQQDMPEVPDASVTTPADPVQNDADSSPSVNPGIPQKTPPGSTGDSPDNSLPDDTPKVPANVYHLIIGDDERVPSVASVTDSEGAVDEDRAYVLRSRKVLFNTTLLTPESPLKAGDTLILDLMSNAAYSVVIDRVSCDSFGSLSILGTIEGADFSTVTITVNNGKVIGTVQDLKNRKLFRIRYSSKDDIQEVLDYDLESMPPRIDLPARIPEEDVLP